MDPIALYEQAHTYFLKEYQNKEKKIHNINLYDHIIHNFSYEYSFYLAKHSWYKSIDVKLYKLFRLLYRISEKKGNKYSNTDYKKNENILFVNSLTHAKIALKIKSQLKNSIILANGYKVKQFLKKNNAPFVTLSEFYFDAKIKLNKNKHSDVYVHNLLQRTSWFTKEMHTCLSQIQPKKFIFFNEVEMFGSLANKVAQDLGIKTIYVQHGLMLKHPSYKKMEADTICVWGNQIQQYLVSLGTNKNKIHITGNPFFDDLPTINKSKKSDNKIPQILYASQPSGFEIKKKK